MKLWIIDTITPVNRINSEWHIIYPVLKNLLAAKRIFSNTELVYCDYNVPTLDYIHHMGFQNKLISELLKVIGFVNHRDVLLFTDARWEYIQMVFEYFKFKSIRPYIMGIWNDGVFNTNGRFNLYYKNKRIMSPSTSGERAMAKCYDLNILPIKEFKNNFLEGVTVKSVVSKLPFDLLPVAYNLTDFKPSSDDKINDILYNPNVDFKVYDDKFKLLINELDQYNWINISKIKSSNIRDILPILIRSKIFLSLENSTSNPIDLYHMTVLGILPLVSNNLVLKNLGIDDDYLLAKHLVSNDKLYKFIRYIPEIAEKIDKSNDEYVTRLEYMNNKLKELYDFNQFITLLYNVRKRKGK